MESNRYTSYLILLFIVTIFLSVLHINGGNLNLQLSVFFKSIFNFSAENLDEIILREIRIPRTVMAIVAGISLSISGLILQNLFSNNLAGPSSLGITSGSSLFVALAVMTSFSQIFGELGVVAIAMLGAIFSSVIILFVSNWVKSNISLLLIGFMLGNLCSAVIQIIQAYSQSDKLKIFAMWGMGSLQYLEFKDVGIVLSILLLTLVFLFTQIKKMNVFVLGEMNAEVLGLNLKVFRISVILVSSLLVGLTTAFCGPIAFIGLTVPNLVKILFKTQNHFILVLASMLVGSIVLLICDLMVYWTEDFFIIPLNSLTALIGSPIVIWVILKSNFR